MESRRLKQGRTGELLPAGWVVRLLAFFFDSALAAVLLPLFFGLSKKLSLNVVNYFASEAIAEGITEDLVLVCVTALAAAFMIAAAAWWLTSCFFLGMLEAFTGGTLGKHLVGLQVLTAKGRRPGIARAVFRQSAKSVSYLFLGLGIALAFLTRRRQTLHDKLSRCVVVGTGRKGPKHMLIVTLLSAATFAALYPSLRTNIEETIARGRRLQAAYEAIGPATELAWRILKQSAADYEAEQ